MDHKHHTPCSYKSPKFCVRSPCFCRQAKSDVHRHTWLNRIVSPMSEKIRLRQRSMHQHRSISLKTSYAELVPRSNRKYLLPPPWCIAASKKLHGRPLRISTNIIDLWVINIGFLAIRNYHTEVSSIKSSWMMRVVSKGWCSEVNWSYTFSLFLLCLYTIL